MASSFDLDWSFHSQLLQAKACDLATSTKRLEKLLEGRVIADEDGVRINAATRHMAGADVMDYVFMSVTI